MKTEVEEDSVDKDPMLLKPRAKHQEKIRLVEHCRGGWHWQVHILQMVRRALIHHTRCKACCFSRMRYHVTLLFTLQQQPLGALPVDPI